MGDDDDDDDNGGKMTTTTSMATAQWAMGYDDDCGNDGGGR